ncbi:MAG: endonuclease III [Candidatus Kerfeldbacteria bacterium]
MSTSRITTIGPVLKVLARRYHGKSISASDRSVPFEILISTILSARTRDETTHCVAHALFSRYKTPRALARARTTDIQRVIHQIGFFRVKAQNILHTSQLLISRHHGHVPRDTQSLMALPGVGRKTANIVRSLAFGVPAIAVDVHVHRISNRLGWITTRTPQQSETALLRIVPRAQWSTVNDVFVKFGKDVCRPITPQCWRCPIRRWCQYSIKTPRPAGKHTRNYARVLI